MTLFKVLDELEHVDIITKVAKAVGGRATDQGSLRRALPRRRVSRGIGEALLPRQVVIVKLGQEILAVVVVEQMVEILIGGAWKRGGVVPRPLSSCSFSCSCSSSCMA